MKETFVEGPKAVIQARYSGAQAAIMICSTLPAILGSLALTVPELLFPTEGHRAFFQYACNVSHDPMSLAPIMTGAVTTLLGLRIPLS
ncbi:hypothetical protein [Haloferula sargassicola]